MRANNVLSRLNFERQSALDSTKSALASAREIIPCRYDQLSLANRRKRALLTFVGRVFKFLFGTFDDTEAKKNHDTMHILMKRQQLTTREVEKLAANFIRFVKTTDDSLTEFSRDFDKIAQTIKHINRDMFHMAEKYEGMIRTIGMLFALFGDTASTRSGTKAIENIGTKWIGAMLQLAQGFLLVELVPYQQMKH